MHKHSCYLPRSGPRIDRGADKSFAFRRMKMAGMSADCSDHCQKTATRRTRLQSRPGCRKVHPRPMHYRNHRLRSFLRAAARHRHKDQNRTCRLYHQRHPDPPDCRSLYYIVSVAIRNRRGRRGNYFCHSASLRTKSYSPQYAGGNQYRDWPRRSPAPSLRNR